MKKFASFHKLDILPCSRYSHPVTGSRPEYIQLQPTQPRLNYELSNPGAQMQQLQQMQQQQPMARSYTSNTSYSQHQYQATSPGRRYTLVLIQYGSLLTMDTDEIAFQEWGASATGPTLIVVSRSWHKTKCHSCPICCS
jgi:hypothetical protein